MKGNQYYDELDDCTFGPVYPPMEYDECPDNPDLLLLRRAAADERKAIAFYLEAALETCLDEVFLDVAEDEMEHYVEVMRLISCLDPVQAKMLREEDLDYLVMSSRPCGKCSMDWAKHGEKPPAEEEDVSVTPPLKRDLCAIRLLTRALADEFAAINLYQRYMNQAENQEVADLFCHLMNEEKEHIAEFTKALFRLTHEPLPTEHD